MTLAEPSRHRSGAQLCSELVQCCPTAAEIACGLVISHGSDPVIAKCASVPVDTVNRQNALQAEEEGDRQVYLPSVLSISAGRRRSAPGSANPRRWRACYGPRPGSPRAWGLRREKCFKVVVDFAQWCSSSPALRWRRTAVGHVHRGRPSPSAGASECRRCRSRRKASPPISRRS